MTAPAAYLIDTHIIVWLSDGDRRLSRTVAELVADPDTRLTMSAVTAWEFCDLQQRGRLPVAVHLGDFLNQFDCAVLDLPSGIWRNAAALPPHHGDPVDRMVIAHAQDQGLTLITADAKMRRYPVATLW